MIWPMAEGFVTVFEVAELLKVNPQTVRNWIVKGTLPAVRVGRRVRIRRVDLDRMLGTGAEENEPSSDSDDMDAGGGSPVESARRQLLGIASRPRWQRRFVWRRGQTRLS
jgi:excisionase family DNA binding protein